MKTILITTTIWLALCTSANGFADTNQPARGLACTGRNVEILIPVVSQKSEAFFYRTSRRSPLLAGKYEVQRDESGQNFESSGLSLHVERSSSSATGWSGTFRVLKSGQTEEGDLLCEWDLGLRAPQVCTWPEPSCGGMRELACLNGEWRCLGGGH